MIQVVYHHHYSLSVPTKVTRGRAMRDNTLRRASADREKTTPAECRVTEKLEEVVETCRGILNVTSALW